MNVASERLPYPGLRSFTREETDIFFGREGCVDDMVDRLAATRFLAVLGASGSGKSSLVKTGLLDALEIGLLHQAGSRWLIVDFRPGDRPMQNLAEALLRAVSPNPADVPPDEEVKLLRAFLARGPRSVVEWSSENLPQGANLLLLVDQFEELFRYSAYAEREEAEAFVALLLESARAPMSEARIYVAITMRSEYLGAAALIDGLAEAINKGLYLTPRMSRDQVRDAIVGPAAVCGFTIEPALVNRLLNDLTSFAPWEDDSGNQIERLVRRADQLPLMQHVLNRLWSLAAARAHEGPVELKVSDYEAVGGLRGALAAHGREILDELLPEHRDIAGAVFRALTSGSTLAEAVRRPTEFGELVQVAGGDEIAVREIVEAFRAPGRNFLMPPRPVLLKDETLIDISHESLIRQWEEFAAWLQREVTSADTWRRLVDAAERYRRGEANLVSGLTLASFANWWDTEHPTAPWAKRYGGDFSATAEFLSESRRAEEMEKEREAEERRQKARGRLVTLAAVLVLCVITPLTAGAAYLAFRYNQEADAADAARVVAERARMDAEQARLVAAAAERERDAQQVALAEAERLRAEEQAARAEAERERADEQAQLALEAMAAEQRALAAQKDAQEQARAADAARAAAEAARERELAAQRQLMALERQRSEEAFRRSILEQVADRISVLQQSGSWSIASNLLGALWQDLIAPSGARQASWLIDPVVTAFARQSLAEDPIFPAFLDYSGTSGWTGTSGRFRVYALDRAAEGDAATGNKSIAVYDALSGAVLGSFELPGGSTIGSEPDLVTPDGTRVAIVTDKSEIALSTVHQPHPGSGPQRVQGATVIPVPDLGGTVGVDQLAPVNSDDRYALYLKLDESPHSLVVVDPATQAISFSVTTQEIAEKAGFETIDDVKLLGFVDGRLIMLINKSGGRVVTVDSSDNSVAAVETGQGVTGAQLTPDGALLLTLTCPGSCSEQHLTALDLRTNTPLWVERVPIGMTLSEEAASEVTVDGAPTYSVLVEQEGSGIVFEIQKEHPETVTQFDAATHARVASIAFDASGGFRTVESATDVTSSSGETATGILANYRIPLSRQKLDLYIAPNSVAVYQGEDAVRVAGVTYDGQLLVYRQRADGLFEDDVAFRPVPIAESNCIDAVAFAGDGKSLLFRHIDGSLRYVAAVGMGMGVDWHKPDMEGLGQDSALSPSSPEAYCSRPELAADEVEQKIAAISPSGDHFALLDRSGTVWWVDVVEGADEAAMKATREFAPLRRGSRDIVWIAGDPIRSRLALVSRTAVEIVPCGDSSQSDAGASGCAAASAGGRGSRGTAEDYSGSSDARAAPANAGGDRQRRLARWNDPKTAAFTLDGDLVVTYGGGQISAFHQGEDGNWTLKFDNVVFRGQFAGLYAAKSGIALATDRDMMLAIDPESGALSGFARLPANPSVMALQADGKALSLEWDTDSVALTAFRPIQPASAAQAARLVAMRSLLDVESDTSLDSLKKIEQKKIEEEMANSAGGNAPSEADCAAEAARRIQLLEYRVLGEPVAEGTLQNSAQCAAGENLAVVRAAERLTQGGSVRQLVEDDSFARLLQLAAAGDATATRLVGAALARITIERGELSIVAVANEAVRFGTSLPAAMLRKIAAGAPIDPLLLDLAKERKGLDAVAHQILAHDAERQINDIERLADALFEFSVAERLYLASGRSEEARYTGHRRAELARLLPDARVLKISSAVEAWAPELPASSTGAAPADLPAEPAARRAFNTENADKLAERLPDSPLLDALRTELERARIVDMQKDNPQEAADRLIELGRRTGAEASWSPDLVSEYVSLAEAIANRAPESAFRLAAEAMKMIGRAFKAPIHSNVEALSIYSRAANIISATGGKAPPELVTSAMGEIDFSFLNYDYGLLPAADATEESNSARELFQSTADMVEVVAEVVSEATPLRRLAGVSLFWKGILVNDKDAEGAIPVFEASAEALRPLVEADPENNEVRFRLAESLRWIGLLRSSSAETEVVERDAVEQYRTVWGNRATLDAGLVNKTGTGYGFSLANLAQTIRENNIVLNDGRTSEDHVGWLFEVLALAAEKDEVNATMIEIGAASGDSTFINGWYRTSSYGWPIGFLSGLVNVESGSQTVTQCDLLAADPYDPLRRAPGVGEVSGTEAEPACRSESDANTRDMRAVFQLARAISVNADREPEYRPLARRAADAGVAAAYSLLAQAMSGDEEDHSDDAYFAASQRTLVESFPVLYPYLSSRAKTEQERLGLTWYARKAAALGVAEAHVALAELLQDSGDRLFHLGIAARLLDEAGDKSGAAAVHARASALPAPKLDQRNIEDEVTAWQPEAIKELPAESDSS